MTSSTPAKPLLSQAGLARLLAGPREDHPVVIDVRWRLAGPPGAESYREGHLPGASYLDLDAELAAPPGAGGRHPLPEGSALQRALRAAGVRAGGLVVAYDDGDGSVAARLWWLLRWAGQHAVAVLDGGFAGWIAAGGAVVTGAGERAEPGDIEVRPGNMPVLTADEAAGLARRGVLIDARAPERYRGDLEPVDPRAGHIPGAVNVPFTGNVDSGGRWRESTGLAERFAAAGVSGTTPVGAYCGSGVTASSIVLALEVAGQPGAALYPGSWSEWAADPARPAVTGPDPG